MASRFLTKRFVHEFGRCVKLSTDVWIASAWVTKSEALDDLLKSGCRAKALVGTHGNATDPEAIELLTDGGCDVRLVDGGALFHPKLYLFRRPRAKTVAWIGSANFTGGGLAGNREAILELDDEEPVSEMETWFKEQWHALRDQDVETALEDYRGRRGRNGVAPYLRSMVDGSDWNPDVPRPARLRREERARWVYDFFGVKCGASSYSRIVQQVLAAFHDMDEGFLDRFAEWDGSRGLKKRYVAKTVAELQLREGGGALPLPNGWKLANQFEDYHYFRGLGENTGMLRKACELVRFPRGVAYEGHVYRQGGIPAKQPPESVAVVGSTRQRRRYWQ